MSEESLAGQHPPLKVAVVGAGYWGPNLVRNFTELESSEVVAVCDRDEGRLEGLGRRYPGLRKYTDFAQALSDDSIEAVSICTPVATHEALAVAALKAGKHVLVEKPMAHSVAAAEAMIAAARAADRILMVDHTFVYSGPVRLIKSIVSTGELGELLYFDSVRINLGLFQTDVNVIWDLAPHDLSIMDFLLQREPRAVSAIGSRHFGDLQNIAYLTVRFEGELIAHSHVNWLAPVKLRTTLIGGSKKMIVYDDLAPSDRVKVYDKGVVVDGDPSRRNQILIDYRTGDMLSPRIDKTEPLKRMCGEFVSSIREKRAPLTDGAAGLRVVRLLEAAQESIDGGGTLIEL